MTESESSSLYLSERFTRRLRRRRGRERLLRGAGVGAVVIAIGMLAVPQEERTQRYLSGLFG